MATQIYELIEAGKPLLITADGAAATNYAKDASYILGVTPVVLPADPLFGVDFLDSAFRSASTETVVILDDVHLADPEMVAKVKELMCDPTRRVVVTCRGDLPEGLDPKDFGHWANFSNKNAKHAWTGGSGSGDGFP